MKKWSTRFLSALCVAALLLGLVPMAALAAEPAHTLWIVGDSTVCSFADPYYYPRYGYGTQIGNYLDGTYKIENLALSGRSSKSFLVEDNYTALKSGIKAGDALIIGFGHNDEKAEAERYTNPNGDWQTAGSFAESLYTNYVKPAQDQGAEVILCTPIVRRNDSGTLSSANKHITSDEVKGGVTYKGGDYPAAIRKLGQDKSVTVVDLTAQTIQLYETLGAAETLYLHAWTGSKTTSVDNTHLNIYGAKVVARMLAEALQQNAKSELGKHVVLGTAPTKDADLKSNPDYKEPTYTSDLPKSALWRNYTATLADGTKLAFRGTVFGTQGGASKIVQSTLETDAKGNAHIVAGVGSKVAASNDGFTMYYYRLPANVPFTFSATATINAFKDKKDAIESQSAFGLMARDDMYVDVNDNSILSDYVAAGTLGGANCFFRKGSALGGKAAMDTKLEVGKSYDVSISYNGDGYTCTFDKEAPQSGGYDFQLTSVDPDYVYIGMFAARGMDVTFSNIALEVEGGIPEGLPDPTSVYLAGDSTVKDYSAKGMYNLNTPEELGSWGEFLKYYFNTKEVAVTSFAQGGRSSRSFINEGKLKSIEGVLCEGDYLFIQFGHNDASDSAENKDERYVPLGTPDAKGVYPSTPGTADAKGAYAWDCGGTYKWYLQQYIDVAKAAKATPVLVTPVSRMYYNDDGTIRPHHDAESTPQDQMTNSYVTAMKQLGQEQNVLVIDMFTQTKDMFEDAYKVANDTYVITPDTYGIQLMGQKTDKDSGAKTTDTTHNNKLGGMIEAAIMANAIQDLKLDISKYVQSPVSLTGKTPDGKTVFTVDAKGKFTAQDILSEYAKEAAYWTGVGQKLLGALPLPEPEPEKPVTGPVAGGGLETLFAELPGVKDADVTAVTYTGAMTGELTGDDFTYLVRDAALSSGKTGVRVDIPGLKAGKYDLTVTAGGKNYTAKGVEVQAHDRSGFAHYNYTEGVGAYNDDGTLKDDAIVLYVTDQNKDKVVLSSKDENREMTVTGIGNILNSNNSKKNLFLLRAIALFDKKPLVVRFLGTVNAPQGVSEFKAGASNGGMVYMLSGANITLEGIGPDATIQGWGFSFGADKNDGKEGLAKNFEVRNLSFKEVPEDCVEVTGRGSSTIEVPVSHAWVHNCAFYRPTDIQNPAESDKVQGDGALDFKWGEYMTSSYNYFDSCHKTSLIGGHDTNPQYHVTWHHNWWKNVETRAPLARQADIHIYNNLYDGQTGYCMSLRAKTYVFSEYNTFLNCKDPVKDEGSGGVCKSYQDLFTDCTGVNNATIVTDKAQKVDSACKYANFDTQADSYVAKGAYKLDTADRGEANIKAWNGTMKAASAMTVVPMTASQATPPADKAALDAAITAAEKTLADIYTVDDDVTVNDVKYPTKFVTKTAKAAYQAAVDAAKAVAAKSSATQAEVDKALADLKAATAVFNKAVKTGAQGRPSGGSSSRPSGGASSSTGKPASDQFTDVAKGAWYESGITYVVNKGLFKGVAEGVFAPNSNMTRAMLMTVLARLDGQNTEGGDTWYAKGMAWSMDKGISDGTLPERNITREQVVTMLYRYAKATAAKGDLSAFTDSASVSDWAKDAMTWAVGQEILKGKDGQRLDPQGTATRAEVATILQRFVEKTGK